MRQPGVKGAALITALLLVTMLFMLMLALHLTVGGRLHFSQNQVKSMQALYLAEAAVAEALSELENDINWSGSNYVSPLGGSHSISFDSATPLAVRSIQNLMSDAPAASYRGPDTVPPRSALLIATAQVGQVNRTLEVLVRRRTPDSFQGAGLQATGAITINGPIRVDGIKALNDATPVPAGLHTNLSTAVADLISWTGLPGQATVTGKVTTVSSDPTAISMAGATVQQGTQVGAPALGFVSKDIVGEIAAHSSAATPSIQSSGVTSLPPGDYYWNGNLEVNGGDLVLNGANLYVSGNLTINGSLSGEGSVHTGGNAVLKGSTDLTSRNTGGLALLAQGNVDLLGYDGTQYLQGLADSDAQLQGYLDQTKHTLSEMQIILNSASPHSVLSNSLKKDTLDGMRRNLGQHFGTTWNGYESNLFKKIQLKVAAQPSSSQRDFLSKKLEKLDKFFDSHTASEYPNKPPNVPAAFADWAAGQVDYDHGWFDAVIDTSPSVAAPYLAEMIPLIQQIDYDHIGESYFQGTIYTKGSLYSANEVSVLGGIFVNGDASNPSRIVEGKTLNPGDILVNNRIHVTAIEETLGGLPGLPAPGDLTVATWLGR